MPLEKNPERRDVPLSMRHAVSISEQFSTGGCKVRPGKTWGIVYPENGARRQRAMQKLLDGSTEPGECTDDLKPSALIFDLNDIETMGVETVKARVRDMTGKMQYYNYERFAEFLATMKGKDADPAMLEQLYDGIAGTRTRSALLEGSGGKAQRDMRTALQADMERTAALLGNLHGIPKVTEALKLRWLQSQGSSSTATSDVLDSLRTSEKALIDSLADDFERFVNTGDQAAYTALVDAIEQQLPALEKISEQPSESMEKLAEELEQYKDQIPAPGDPAGPNFPPDAQDLHNQIEQLDNGESVEGVPNAAHFEITPSGTSQHPMTGHYAIAHKSRFVPEALTWSNDTTLDGNEYTASIQGTERQTMTGTINPGLKNIALPATYALDISSLQFTGARPVFLRDQNGCFYATANGVSTFSIDFLKEPGRTVYPPTNEDLCPLPGGALSDASEQLVSGLSGNAVQKAQAIRKHIKGNHWYPGGGDPNSAKALKMKVKTESTAQTYAANIDTSEYLDCDLSDTLGVHLLRRANIPARLVIGHLVEAVKDGIAQIDGSNGHAWAEFWDGVQWTPIDFTPSAKPEDKKKNEKEDEQKKEQGMPADDEMLPDSPEQSDLTDQAQDRVDQQMDNVREQAQQNPTDEDVQQGEKMLEDAETMMEKMRQRLKDFQQQAKKDDSFSELEKTREEAKEEGLLPEDQDELDRNINAKGKKMREEMKEKLAAMEEDGFIDEAKKEQLEKRLDAKDAEELDRLWEEIDQQGSLHSQFESIRDEVQPLVDKWYKHFYEQLPRRYDQDTDPDTLVHAGGIDRHALRHSRNLMFGTVFNPRILRSTAEPRFLASIMVDVSGSMEGEKLRNAQKLLVFYCELFTRISKEFGYIRFAASTFSDNVTPIKKFAHDYDSAERFEYPDGTSTVKARLMTHLKTAGGTDMLAAVKIAAEELHAEMDEYPDFASAFYFVGDGDDTRGNSWKVKQFVEADDQEQGLGKVMRSAILLGREHERETLGAIFGPENTTVAGSFEDMVEQSMEKFGEQIGDYMEKFQ